MVMEVSGGAGLVFIVIISVMSPLEAETTFYQGLPAARTMVGVQGSTCTSRRSTLTTARLSQDEGD